MIRLASRPRHQDGPDMDERPDQIEGMMAFLQKRQPVFNRE